MKLLLKRNKKLSYNKQSGKICSGFNKCPYPDSITNRKLQGFKDEPKTSYVSCPFRKYIGPVGIRLAAFTRAEWKKFEEKHTLCMHPKEIIPTQEWRCYKCNALVESERTKHKCLC